MLVNQTSSPALADTNMGEENKLMGDVTVSMDTDNFHVIYFMRGLQRTLSCNFHLHV